MRNTKNVDKTMGSAAMAPSISVAQVLEIGSEHAVVLFNVPLPSSRSFEGLSREVAMAFNNRLRVMDNSAFFPRRNAMDNLIQAVVCLNQEIVSFPTAEQASAMGLKPTSGNIFRDGKDNIWRRMGEGDDAMLVREGQEDLSGLLKARRALNVETASSRVTLAEEFRPGQPIGWYDVRNETVRFGIALTPVLAFDLATQNACRIVPNQVFLASDADDVMLGAMANAVPEVSSNNTPLNSENFVAKHVDFMRVLYGKRPEYFNRLLNLLREAFGSAAVRAQ